MALHTQNQGSVCMFVLMDHRNSLNIQINILLLAFLFYFILLFFFQMTRYESRRFAITQRKRIQQQQQHKNIEERIQESHGFFFFCYGKHKFTAHIEFE